MVFTGCSIRPAGTTTTFQMTNDLIRAGVSPMAGVFLMSEEYKVREERRKREMQREGINDAFTRVGGAVCEFYGLPVEQLTRHSRKRTIVKCRQVTAYFLRKHKAEYSLKQIGAKLEYDHTTVIHCVDSVTDLMETYPAYANDISNLAKIIE